MSSQNIPVLIINRDGTEVQHGTIPITDFNDTAKWDMSPVSKSLGLPLKAHGVASDLSDSSKSDEHTYANTSYLDYNPYSTAFGKMICASYVGDQVILARCDGLPLDGFIVSAMHGHITALTCDGKKCGSKNACVCAKDSEQAKAAIAHATTKKVFSAQLERAKMMMAMIPGAEKIKNPFDEEGKKEGAMPFCAGCGRAKREDGTELMQCSKCQKAYYCGKKCQKGEWPEHKKMCKKAEA